MFPVPEPGSLRGQLLIASATLLDPNFQRTVVLVAEHSDEGAMGVVLNRPSPVIAAEAVPILADLVGDDEPVYVGGPVQPGAVVALAEYEEPDLAAAIAFGDVGFLPAEADSDELTGMLRRVRVYAGYAGWSPGQLEAELEEEAWIVEPAVADDVFASEADLLWPSVLTRKGGQFALLARMPLDPSVN
jgi:putative transcriptional regulator